VLFSTDGKKKWGKASATASEKSRVPIAQGAYA